MNSENQFGNLSAENETSRFAQMTNEEHSEFQTWIDDCQKLSELEPKRRREVIRVASKLP